VELASAWGPGVVFVATYRPTADDPEMDDRVRRHRAERPAWRTLEAPADASAALAAISPAPSGVVIDCLTLWLSDRLGCDDDRILSLWDEQLCGMRSADWPTVVVGNEVGWSLVPDSPVLRRFRDLAGMLAQRTASAADEAWLMVAGCPLRLK
jgi:adenosylcobinamide kinase/adenosylcobinamide-phosphate guanylyltransferase